MERQVDMCTLLLLTCHHLQARRVRKMSTLEKGVLANGLASALGVFDVGECLVDCDVRR